MKSYKISQFRKTYPQAAQLLEKHFEKNGVQFTDDRASIHERSDGLLRARLKGPTWGRVDYDKTKRVWREHTKAA